MVAAKEANPDATQQQIAEVVGISRSRVSEIVGEVSAKSEPKLLKHGGNMAEQDSYNNLGRGKPYILARLKRDGHQELAEQVKAGMLSARKTWRNRSRCPVKDRPRQYVHTRRCPCHCAR